MCEEIEREREREMMDDLYDFGPAAEMSDDSDDDEVEKHGGRGRGSGGGGLERRAHARHVVDARNEAAGLLEGALGVGGVGDGPLEVRVVHGPHLPGSMQVPTEEEEEEEEKKQAQDRQDR